MPLMPLIAPTAAPDDMDEGAIVLLIGNLLMSLISLIASIIILVVAIVESEYRCNAMDGRSEGCDAHCKMPVNKGRFGEW